MVVDAADVKVMSVPARLDNRRPDLVADEAAEQYGGTCPSVTVPLITSPDWTNNTPDWTKDILISLIFLGWKSLSWLTDAR